MMRKACFIFVLSALAISSSYTIIAQQIQIEQLEQQLQEVTIKYDIIKNDPLAQDAFEAGG